MSIIFEDKILVLGGSHWYWQYLNIDLDDPNFVKYIFKERMRGKVYCGTERNDKYNRLSFYQNIFSDNNKTYLIGQTVIHKYLLMRDFKNYDPKISIVDITNVNIFSGKGDFDKTVDRDYVQSNFKDIIDKNLSEPQSDFGVYFDALFYPIKLKNKYYLYTRHNPEPGARYLQVFIGENLYNFKKKGKLIKFINDNSIDNCYEGRFYSINDKIYGLIHCYDNKFIKADKQELYDNRYLILVASNDGISFMVLKKYVGVDKVDNNFFYPLKFKKENNRFRVIWGKYHKKTMQEMRNKKEYDLCFELVREYIEIDDPKLIEFINN